jgi:hypothetical protein
LGGALSTKNIAGTMPSAGPEQNFFGINSLENHTYVPTICSARQSAHKTTFWLKIAPHFVIDYDLDTPVLATKNPAIGRVLCLASLPSAIERNRGGQYLP